MYFERKTSHLRMNDKPDGRNATTLFIENCSAWIKMQITSLLRIGRKKSSLNWLPIIRFNYSILWHRWSWIILARTSGTHFDVWKWICSTKQNNQAKNNCAVSIQHHRIHLVIGFSKTSRCFKGVKNLPVSYAHSRNSWNTSPIKLSS